MHYYSCSFEGLHEMRSKALPVWSVHPPTHDEQRHRKAISLAHCIHLLCYFGIQISKAAITQPAVALLLYCSRFSWVSTQIHIDSCISTSETVNASCTSLVWMSCIHVCLILQGHSSTWASSHSCCHGFVFVRLLSVHTETCTHRRTLVSHGIKPCPFCGELNPGAASVAVAAAATVVWSLRAPQYWSGCWQGHREGGWH